MIRELERETANYLYAAIAAESTAAAISAWSRRLLLRGRVGQRRVARRALMMRIW